MSNNETINRTDYKSLYEKASTELDRLQKTEVEKRVSLLMKQNKQLHKDVEHAAGAIDAATDVIEEIPAIQNELKELREFATQADEVISTLESLEVGQKRLASLVDLVGDTYTKEDIPTLASMSDEAYEHLIVSMNKIVDKIEETADELNNQQRSENKTPREEDIVNTATRAMKRHKKNPRADMLVKASSKDPMTAARNLIKSALHR